MKTALVSLCYLDGLDVLGNDRLERNKRYLRYYLGLQDEFGFDEILLLDNASSAEATASLLAEYPQIDIFRFLNHLPRKPIVHGYPYCWRGLYHYAELMKEYDKIIYIDSDGFVLTKRLAHYIRNLKSGWTTFLAQTQNFPEAALHILCPDAYPILLKYFEVPWQTRVGTLMETSLPFTHVETKFKCGRYGERFHEDRNQHPSQDYYGQAPLNIPLTFEMGK